MEAKESKEGNYKNFLEGFLSKGNENETPKPTLPSSENKTVEVRNNFTPKIEKVKSEMKGSTIEYFENNKSKFEEIFLNELPMGDFYYENTKIYFRACTTKEIQDFSTFDINNPFDFKEKINDIIEKCIVLVKEDGTYASHLDLYDGDRVWLIYLIREKTFPKGRVLTTTVTYEDNNKEKKTQKIELKRANFEVWRKQPIMDFFNIETRVLEIPTTEELNNETFIISPPTIGLRNCFDQYMEINVKKGILNKDKDSPFFKIAPYLKPKVTYMSYDELVEYEEWFKETMKPDTYSFLFDLINNHLKIGLRGLKKNMGSTTLRTHKVYPDNLRTLFLLQNAFELFVKKQDNSKRAST